MPKMFEDGTVISSNMNVVKRDNHISPVQNNSTLKATIVGRHTIDSVKNVNKTHTEYEVRVIEGNFSGRCFLGAIASESFGSYVNFNEISYIKANNLIANTSKSNKTSNQYLDGSTVIITFVNGMVPVILGAYPNDSKRVKSASSKDGDRILGEYNGVRWNINNDGELTISYLGGKRTKDIKTNHPKTERSNTAPSMIKIDKVGNIKISQLEATESLPNFSTNTEITGRIINEILMDRVLNKVIINSENIELGDATLERICKSKMFSDYINDKIIEVYHNHDHPLPPLTVIGVGSPLIGLGTAPGKSGKPAKKMTKCTEDAISSKKHKVG